MQRQATDVRAQGPSRARVRSQIAQFLSTQAGSGAILMLCALLAVGMANSPWAANYEQFWTWTPAKLVGQVGTNESGFVHGLLSHDLRFLLNEVGMVFFFLVVGLEIRRELHAGELSDPRRAALPIVAACGGMIVPALIYLSANWGLPTQRGWGVPVATDIAFAVGALALLGDRIPPALRVLLLALAVIDDVGAIGVIGFAYSSGLQPSWLLASLLGIAAILGLRRLRVRTPWIYGVPAVAIWIGLVEAHIHPTLTGVIVGLLTPIALPPAPQPPANSPITPILEPLLTRLHPWVAYAIMPLFALANAGVALHPMPRGFSGASPFAFGIAAGLLVGKPLGVVLACVTAAKLGLVKLPQAVNLRGLVVVGMAASIGFTMAIFVANLAFVDAESRALAKVAILGSTVSACVLVALAGFALMPKPRAGAAALATLEQAEQSTEL